MVESQPFPVGPYGATPGPTDSNDPYGRGEERPGQYQLTGIQGSEFLRIKGGEKYSEPEKLWGSSPETTPPELSFPTQSLVRWPVGQRKRRPKKFRRYEPTTPTSNRATITNMVATSSNSIRSHSGEKRRCSRLVHRCDQVPADLPAPCDFVAKFPRLFTPERPPEADLKEWAHDCQEKHWPI